MSQSVSLAVEISGVKRAQGTVFLGRAPRITPGCLSVMRRRMELGEEFSVHINGTTFEVNANSTEPSMGTDVRLNTLSREIVRIARHST